MRRRILAVLLAVLMLLPASSVTVNAAATMRPSQSLINVLKKMEGFSKYPYADNGQWTVGYGTRCPDDKLTDYKTNGITEKEALALLDEQLSGFAEDVNAFAATHALTLKQHQFDALVSFSYNCGSAWMNELTGFFNAAVRDGNTGNALIYGMCLYSTAGGQYSLISRRMCEANMYINGVYKAPDDTNPYPSSYRWVFLEDEAGKVRYKICGFDAALAEPIQVSFSSIPTGKDADGNAFAYTLAGWYTSGDKKVTKLDSSLTRGQTLYAKWKDPDGNIVTPPQNTSQSSFPKTGTVNGSGVNVRSGPGTSNSIVGQKNTGDRVTVLEEQKGGSFTWGRIGQDQWIALTYVTYDADVVTGIKLLQKPTKLTYYQPVATVDPGGSVLLVTYADGRSQAMTVHRSMLSGFNGSKTGKQTVKISYGGKTASFQVTVNAPVITSSTYRISGKYIRGVAPGTTAQQLLAGLNPQGAVKLYGTAGQLTGDALVGTAMKAALMDGSQKKAEYTVIILGDVNGDGKITKTDAQRVLQYVAGWDVSLSKLAADADGDGKITSADASRILQYVGGWKNVITQ